MTKQVWDLKLVPVSDPNADGRHTSLELDHEPAFSEVIGDEFVVMKRRQQPFYQHGGHWSENKGFVL